MNLTIISLCGLVFVGCSVTVGTVNLNQGGEANPKTEVTETKPTTVKTDADVPISALP